MDIDDLLIATKGPVWDQIVDSFPCRPDPYKNCPVHDNRSIGDCERWWITVEQRNKVLKAVYLALATHPGKNSGAEVLLEMVEGKIDLREAYAPNETPPVPDEPEPVIA